MVAYTVSGIGFLALAIFWKPSNTPVFQQKQKENFILDKNQLFMGRFSMSYQNKNVNMTSLMIRALQKSQAQEFMYEGLFEIHCFFLLVVKHTAI